MIWIKFDHMVFVVTPMNTMFGIWLYRVKRQGDVLLF